MRQTIGICGCGKIGLSFLNLVSDYEFDIVVYVRNGEKLEKAREDYKRRKTFSGRDLTDPDSVKFTADPNDLVSADIVFEFISEDLYDKIELIETLVSRRKNPRQIICTGSSSFVPSRLSPHYLRDHIIGVHFIYPLQYIKSVEVIVGSKTDKTCIGRIKEFLGEIGSSPVVLDEKIGAVTTRILVDYQNEAFNISRELDIPFEYIDDIVARGEYVLPPFITSDIAGLDIILNCVIEHFGNGKEAARFSGLKEYLIQKVGIGHLGKKAKNGFYGYSGEVPDRTGSLSDDLAKQIDERLRLLYLNSCLRLLDGCWLSSRELDRLLCDLSQVETGPVDMAFGYGTDALLAKLDEYARSRGNQFTAPAVLKYAVKNRVGREEIDGQIRLFTMGEKRPDWHHKDFGFEVSPDR